LQRKVSDVGGVGDRRTKRQLESEAKTIVGRIIILEEKIGGHKETEDVMETIRGVRNEIKDVQMEIGNIKVEETEITKGNSDGSEFILLLNDLREDFDREIGDLMQKLQSLERKNENLEIFSQNISKNFELLQKAYQDLDSSVQNTLSAHTPQTQPQIEPPPTPTTLPIELPENLITEDQLSAHISPIFSKLTELSSLITSKASTSDFAISLSALEGQINGLKSRPVVSVNDHQQLFENFSSLQEKVSTLSASLDELTESTAEMSSDLSAKASKKELEKITSISSSNHSALANHLNELQTQIDAFTSESPPDFSKPIEALQSRLESINSSTSSRLFALDKKLEDAFSILSDLGEASQKTNRYSIKLEGNFESTKKKLDLLDEAFNGFMVPSNLFGGGDTSEIDFVKESLSSLRKEFFKHKDETNENFRELSGVVGKM
jgi:chromosome segregation ATPase